MPEEQEPAVNPATKVEVDFTTRKAELDLEFKNKKEQIETRQLAIQTLQAEVNRLEVEKNQIQGAWTEIDRLEQLTKPAEKPEETKPADANPGSKQ